MNVTEVQSQKNIGSGIAENGGKMEGTQKPPSLEERRAKEL